MLKKNLLFLFCLMGTLAVAKPQNDLLNRDFWKKNPSVEMVKAKIKMGNDATLLNDRAFDPVTLAILENANDKVIKYMMTLDGNSIEKRTHDSRTYIFWAAYAGNVSVMKHLLKKGANLDLTGSHGNTPATFAAGAGQTNTEVYELFEKHGLDLVQNKNKNGANLLLLIASHVDNFDLINYFTDKGLDISSTDNDGNGIFNYAAQNGNVPFLKELIKKDIPYQNLNKKGENAVIFAARRTRGHQNELAVFQYLKKIGLNPNIVTTNGDTPLKALAYKNSNASVFKFLLAEGADVDHKDTEGNTAFLNAARQNSFPIVKLLGENVKDFGLSNQKGQNALMLAVWKNDPKVVDFILEQTSTVNSTDKKGNTPGYYLVSSFNKSKPETMEAKLKALQQKGLKFNTLQAEGNTLYHVAAKENNLELFQKLADFDIDINIQNDEGLTALHIAAMKANNVEILKYLVSKNANPALRTDFEETAYDFAQENETLQKQDLDLNFLKA